MTGLSRRTFLKVTGATSLALAAGPSRWGWAVEGSPFGPLKDDPILRSPEGYTYEIVGQTGMMLEGGRGPTPRPHSPDLNVVFPQPSGKLLLSTSHEIPPQAPLGTPPPRERYDRVAMGSITSLLLNPDLSIAESAYNAGGMLNNCSGGRTPWGTVLTGEESTQRLERPHGFIWEVDPHRHTKVRLDACGKFEHETARVDPQNGFVYLTEDSGTDSLLYRMRPHVPGKLHKGGVLEAYRRGGRWVRIADPCGRKGKEPSKQGIEKGALRFARLEGGHINGGWFYFTETEDDTTCGKIWRLHRRTSRLELWAQGGRDAALCMPDNMAFDRAGNMFVCEDKAEDSDRKLPNRVMFIDRETGNVARFAALNKVEGANTDEPTGPAFSPDGRILFLNLQRSGTGGLTLAIKGPFPRRASEARLSRAATPPPAAQPEERAAVLAAGIPAGAAAAATALLSLRRRGRIDDLPGPLEEMAVELGPPAPVEAPKRRLAKQFD